jgi:hypothetical protein
MREPSLVAGPARHAFPPFPQFPVVRAKIGVMSLHQRPETRRVIHFRQVAELMHHHVTHQRGIQKQQFGVQADRLVVRATPPAGALAFEADAPERKPQLPAQFLEKRRQMRVGLAHEPARERGAAGLFIGDAAVNQQPARAGLTHRRPGHRRFLRG